MTTSIHCSGSRFPGVDELIGLLELTRLAESGRYPEVVVDTAPTGHTLRLLAMPASLRRIADILEQMQAKHRYLSESLAGRYRSDGSDLAIGEIAARGLVLEPSFGIPASARFIGSRSPRWLRSRRRRTVWPRSPPRASR